MNLQIYLFFNWSLIIILIHRIWIKSSKGTRYLVISFILSLIGFLFNNLPVVVGFGLVLVFSSPHLFSWNYIKTNKKFIISINLLLYLYYPMILYRIINSYNSYLGIYVYEMIYAGILYQILILFIYFFNYNNRDKS